MQSNSSRNRKSSKGTTAKRERESFAIETNLFKLETICNPSQFQFNRGKKKTDLKNLLPNQIPNNANQFKITSHATVTLMRRTNDRNQSPVLRFLLVEELIVRNPKCSVEADDHCGDYQRNEHIQPYMREHERDDCDNSKRHQNDSVINLPVEDDDRIVAEEIEEEPGDEHDQEHDHRDRMPQEAEEDDKEDDDGVIDAEVAEIEVDSGSSVGEAVGAAEGGGVGELAPRPPSRHDRSAFLLRARDEFGARGGIRRRWGGDGTVSDLRCHLAGEKP